VAQKRHQWFLYFLLFTFVAIPVSAWTQQKPQWRVKNRLQLGYEFDDNIREVAADSLDPTEDSSLRLLFNSRATLNTPKYSIAFTYRGGLQTYAQNDIENKLINEISASAGFRMDKVVVGLRIFGRLKNYLNDVLDYSTGSAEVYVQLPRFFNWNNEFALSASGIDYQNFTSFNYSENQLKWRFSRRIFRRVSVSMQLAGRQVRFDRSAVKISEDFTTTLLTKRQKDHIYQLQLQFNYTKSFLINLAYSLQKNSSNSSGYGFTRHQFTLTFGLPLSGGVWLRGFAAAQFKDYSENLRLLFPIDVDTEREDSNFFTVDLSKDLNRSVTVLLRFASYNNESVLRNVFYRKNIFTLGLDLRF